MIDIDVDHLETLKSQESSLLVFLYSQATPDFVSFSIGRYCLENPDLPPLVSVNTDKHVSNLRRLGVVIVPQLRAYRNGILVHKVVGFSEEQEVHDAMRRCISEVI